MGDQVLCEDLDGVRIITINRTHVRNAIDLATAQLLAEAFDGLSDDPALRVGILTGAGGGFSAGMDLRAFGTIGQRPVIPGRGLAGLTETPPGKPLIAAVEGFALAGGFEIVLACDLVVAAHGARFGIPEVKRGLIAAGGGLLRLPRRLPRNVAMELALTGGEIRAERAHHLGLVNRLTEQGQALAEARRLAAEITVNGPLAVTASKQIIAESQDWPQQHAFDIQRPFASRITDSADAREGALAFVEKRPPRWSGC